MLQSVSARNNIIEGITSQSRASMKSNISIIYIDSNLNNNFLIHENFLSLQYLSITEQQNVFE